MSTNILRQHAEHQFAEELYELAQADTRQRPPPDHTFAPPNTTYDSLVLINEDGDEDGKNEIQTQTIRAAYILGSILNALGIPLQVLTSGWWDAALRAPNVSQHRSKILFTSRHPL